MDWLWIALVVAVCVGAALWMLRGPGGGDDDTTPQRWGGGGGRGRGR
jgi:ABC-type transporter Mla subunit MlaD